MPIEEKPPTNELRRLVFQIERLPTMPLVVNQLIEALGDDLTTPAELERIILSDQALASKVLSMANSAYYGFSQKIATIKRAMVVIGFRELQLLAMGASLAGVFDLQKVPAGFDGEGLWTHCMVVSWTARELASISRHAAPGEIMIAGLLHDLGKLVLSTHLTDHYAQVLKKVEEGTPYYEAEKELGLMHTTIGNWLAKKWSLPDIHVAAIRDHHSPRKSDPQYVSTCMILLANMLAKKFGIGLVQEAQPVEISQAMSAANLTWDQLRLVATMAKSQIPPLLKMWHQISTKRDKTDES